VSEAITRIFSDVHYGDRASTVRSLQQLTPLLEGVGTVVLNGDTIDTRQGPYPERNAAFRAELDAFRRAAKPQIVLLTGNHDPDLSPLHTLDLAGGRVFVTHGDVLFSDIVPWGRDAPQIRERIAAARAKLTPAELNSLETQFAIFRAVCGSLRQRHQAERDPWKYLLSFTLDVFWPLDRPLRILRAWRQAPERAAALARAHRPAAQYVILGHLHRPGIWKTRDGRVIINTGSFCRPLGACLVDVTASRLVVRRIVARDGAYHPGKVLAEFALAEA
jgi:predicted phosphodiesterase